MRQIPPAGDGDTRVIVTTRSLCAVPLRDGAMPKGPAIQVPPGTELRVCKQLPDSHLVQVQWGERRYAVFGVDLCDDAGSCGAADSI